MGSSNSERKRSHGEVETEAASQTSATTPEHGAQQSSKRARIEERRSIFVRSLPPNATNETLADFFSQHFPVRHAVVVADQTTKQSRGYGFVTFADAQDATEAKNSLDKTTWDGRCIRVEVAEPRHRNSKEGTISETARKVEKSEARIPPKLIVRNLPWSVKTSDQLSHIFRSFGKVKFADLPQSKGKLKGFGFVTIRGKKNAEKALEAINGKEIDGRTLAVDWAVNKDSWSNQKNQKQEDSNANEGNSDGESDGISSLKPDDDSASAADGEEKLDADMENFLKAHMQNLEEDDEDDEDGDEDEEDIEGMDQSRHTHRSNGRSTDNSSTVFVRNLPFTTTDQQLKTFFEQFGTVRYARIVIDKVTDKPAGTGFVCFLKQIDAKTCVKEAPRLAIPEGGAKHSVLQDENADPSGRYTLEGRQLRVFQAVDKDEAEQLTEKSLASRHEKDKRRLYLLSEGAIGRDSPLFNLMSHSEVQMRQASAGQRKKLVQSNPSLHVSLTRLSLRNIPQNIGSKELKELARKAIVEFAKDVKEGRRQPLSKEENARDGKDAKMKEKQRKSKGKGIVRQAKVVFESNQGSKIPEASGAGKSRGYGFIEYTSHHWALMGLRYLNGHQLKNDIGKNQRLIAEFAIENAQVVQRRRANEEKASQASQQSRVGRDTKVIGTEHVNAKSSAGHADGRPKRAKNQRKETVTKDVTEADGEKDSMKQRLIARTRLMRKKKAKARGKH